MKLMHSQLFIHENRIFILAVICMLLSWLSPNHYFPWETFYNDFLAAVSLWLLFLSLVVRYKISVIPLYIFIILLLALIPVVQYFFGIIVFAGDALIVSVYLASFAVAVLVGDLLFSSEGSALFLTVAICFVCGATLSSFLALYQWLELTQWGNWAANMRPSGRPFANLGQPNNFATLECLGLVSILYLWERKTLSLSVSILVGWLLLIGVVLSQSRTPWIIAFVFITWWLWKRNTVNLRLKVSGIISCLAVYGFLVYVLPLFHEWYGVGADLVERVLGVDDARRIIWSQLWDAVLRGPVWGYGWNQVGLAQILVATHHPPSVYTEHSHNLFLDLLLWNGPILGAILVFAVVYFWIKEACACKSLEGWFGLACIAFLLAHGMLEYPLEYAYFLFPLGIIVGGVLSLDGHSKTISVSRWLMACVLVLATGVLSVIFVEYSIIEEDGRLMRFETARIGNIRAEQAAPPVKLLTQLREYHRFARTEAQIDMSSDEIEWMEQVAHRYGYPSALLRYSLVLFLNNRVEEGKVELIRLRQLHGLERYREAVKSLIDMSEKYPQLKDIIPSSEDYIMADKGL